MKIANLGCGADIHPDAWNVDFRWSEGVNQVADLSTFPWPLTADSYDEVRMFDFLEHFEMAKTRRIVEECRRILKDDGRLVIQVPDMDILANAIKGNSDFPCFRCGAFLKGYSCVVCSSTDVENREAAFGRIYGGQDYPGNYHMSGFTKDSLVNLLSDLGFGQFELLEEKHQEANWNMKISGRKTKVSLWK
jgi:hypothetical protein